METTRRIVVGVDGSPASAAALRWAYDRAAAWRATLHAVHASHLPPLAVSEPVGWPVDTRSDDEEAAQLCAAQVDAVAAEAQQHPPHIERSVAHDTAAGALLTASEGADLVVVGSRGRGGFKGLLLGSVSHQVAHHVTCPVAIIRSDSESPSSGPIVVGADGSAGSIDALAFALRDAVAERVPVVALAAWSWIDQPGDHFDPEFGEAEVRTRAESAVQTARQLVPGSDAVEVEVRLVNDLPARALLAAAEGGRMLVVGSRGRGGFKGLMLGSVSEQCVRHATGPVVVVHPSEPPSDA